MCPLTIFHEILHLVMEHIPNDYRLKFYEDLLRLLGKYKISLDFLTGEDEYFDMAHKKFKDNE